jgi:hypothetical protein
MGLYGDGLTRIVAFLRAHDPALVDRLADDGLLSGLLVLHDLHPFDEVGRIRRALERLGGGAEYLGTGEDGVVRVRLEGCRSGAGAVEAAVRGAAPETTAVVVAAGAPLVQIGMGPPPGWRPAAPPEGRAS